MKSRASFDVAGILCIIMICVLINSMKKCIVNIYLCIHSAYIYDAESGMNITVDGAGFPGAEYIIVDGAGFPGGYRIFIANHGIFMGFLEDP